MTGAVVELVTTDERTALAALLCVPRWVGPRSVYYKQNGEPRKHCREIAPELEALVRVRDALFQKGLVSLGHAFADGTRFVTLTDRGRELANRYAEESGEE